MAVDKLTCLEEAFRTCPLPEASSAAVLPDQDAEDALHRELWKTCVLQHAAAVGCLRAGVDAGLINPPKGH